MFSLDIVDTDKFLEMPSTTQSLYFHLGMRADDEGFISSPKKISSMTNCSNDDLRLLVAKGYLIPFNDGVVVITDWKVNNWIRPDRKQETRFKNELSMLTLENDVYRLSTKCQPNVNQMPTQCHTEDRLGKDSLDKVSSSTPAAKKNYIDFFENNFHMISSHEFQILNSFINDGMNEDVIKLALERAVENNVRTISYVKAILQKWLENNIKTVEGVKAEQLEFERNKQLKPEESCPRTEDMFDS